MQDVNTLIIQLLNRTEVNKKLPVSRKKNQDSGAKSQDKEYKV